MPTQPPPQLPEHLFEWNNDDAAPATARDDGHTTNATRPTGPSVVRGAWTLARRFTYAAMVEVFTVRSSLLSACGDRIRMVVQGRLSMR